MSAAEVPPEVRASLPDLDRHALVLADLAFLEEPAGTPTAERVTRAIAAYLWAVDSAAPFGNGAVVYPSLNDYRAARAALGDADGGEGR